MSIQFILHLAATPTASAAQLAFCDARRLGRIRLCTSPIDAIANLGFDPILSMPSLDDFSVAIRKRKCTIKALLLDQSFSAGVGNWVAGAHLSNATQGGLVHCFTKMKSSIKLVCTQNSARTCSGTRSWRRCIARLSIYVARPLRSMLTLLASRRTGYSSTDGYVILLDYGCTTTSESPQTGKGQESQTHAAPGKFLHVQTRSGPICMISMLSLQVSLLPSSGSK